MGGQLSTHLHLELLQPLGQLGHFTAVEAACEEELGWCLGSPWASWGCRNWGAKGEPWAGFCVYMFAGFLWLRGLQAGTRSTGPQGLLGGSGVYGPVTPHRGRTGPGCGL